MPTPPTHRLTHLLLPLLSITLNLAILGTSSRTLHIYQTSQTSNVYFLPIWNSHFDMRGLQTLVGTSVGIVVLNGIFAVGAVLQLPTNTILLASSLSSTLLSIIALALQATLNHQSPQRDTLQTWTCMWKNVQGEGVPQSFDTLCHETRFAFYTTIPSFLIQLSLLALAGYALTAKSATSAHKRRSVIRLDEEEKAHELVERQQQSFDTKSDSARSTPDQVRVVAGKR
ncbi:hypothetical protein SMMN14_02810 [Sphaerulina musiva]